MMRRGFAGFLMVIGGAAMIVGVFPNWARVIAAGADHTVNGFNLGSGNMDAIVTFAAGGVLVLVGLMVASSAAWSARALGFFVGVLALAWAGLITLLFSGYEDRVNHFVSGAATQFAGIGTASLRLHLGYYLVAGGAVLGFLGGLAGLGGRGRLYRAPAGAPSRAVTGTRQPAPGAGAPAGAAPGAQASARPPTQPAAMQPPPPQAPIGAGQQQRT